MKRLWRALVAIVALGVVLCCGPRLAGAEAAVGPEETYAEAYRVTAETGKPMVVMVCAEWCVPCQRMRKGILPWIRKRGLLRKVSFAIVDHDNERDLAEKLTAGGPIPQLVIFRKTAGGWLRQTLVGAQSVESVETFLNEGPARDEAEKKSTAEKIAIGTPAG